jgi:hypothetical protein
MVTKSRKQSTEGKKGRVKVGKLKVNKETVKDLGQKEWKYIKGGMGKKTGYGCGDTATCGCPPK